MSVKDVVMLAENDFKGKEINFENYDKPLVRYNVEDKRWHVQFSLKKSGVIFKKVALGGDYNYIIDDTRGVIVDSFWGL